MASTLKLSLIVSAVDEATAPIRRINQAINGLTAGPRAVGAALGRLAAEVGLNTVATRANALGGALRNAWQEAGNLALRLGTIAGLGGGGLLGLTKMTAEYGEQVLMASQRLGMSTAAFQRHAFAASQNAVQVEQFADAMRFLAANAVAAANGSEEMATWFRAAGVSVRDARGQIKGTDELFLELADAFARSSKEEEKVKVAQTLLGQSGARMIPLLNQGAAAIRRMGDEAERLGLVMSQDKIEQAEEFGDHLDVLGQVVRTVGLSIGSVLIPVIQPLVVRLTEWVAANRELIAVKVGEFVERVVDALPDLVEGARNVATGFQGVVEALRWAGETFGYAETAAVAVGLYLGGPLIGALANVTLAAALFGTSLGGVALRLGALAFAPVVAAIGNFVTALRAGQGAMAAFNLVLAANPIGATIAAVTALAGAAYLIYRNWEPISGFFTGLFDGIVGVVTGAVESIRRVWGGIAQWIGEQVQAIAGVLPDFVRRRLGFDAAVAGAAPPVAASVPALAAPPASAPGVAPALGPGAQPFEGELVVRFVDAPPGTRVERLSSNGAGPDIGVDLGPTMVMP